MKDQQQQKQFRRHEAGDGKVRTNLQQNLTSVIPYVMAVVEVARERGGWLGQPTPEQEKRLFFLIVAYLHRDYHIALNRHLAL